MEPLLPIVLRSLSIGAAATALATLAGLPLALLLALGRFPGRGALVILVNALLGLPPVVVGLAIYLLLSRAGPLGALGWLYTPGAMILAQAVLATPLVAALSHRALSRQWARYGWTLRAAGASPSRSVPHLLRLARPEIATAILAGFGRSISEVGAVLIVGGNIAGATRTMTTAIALETGKGNLDLALALGLVLIGISITVSALVLLLSGDRT